MQIPDYISGTVSIENGSTSLTGSGTAWKTADLKEGDIFYKGGYSILIASVDSDTGITLADAWPGSGLEEASYAIRYAPDNSRVQGQTRQLLDLWRQGIYVTPDAVGTLAGRDDYDDQPEGFKYLADDSDPWTLYAKVSNDSGDWSAGTAWGGPKGDQGLPGSSNVVGTSTTSLAIATGSKTFTIAETDRGWGVGARLRASSDANGANFMEGVVTAYSDTSLTLSVDLTGGSGTKADWTINLAGQPTLGEREVLSADRTYYVDGTSGSDSNSGLSNGAGAFATIKHALDVVWNQIDTAGFNITISVADGTYTDAIWKESPNVGGGEITIQGNTTTPANVLIDVTGDNAIRMYCGAFIIVKGVKIQSTARGLYAAWGGTIWFDKVDFGTCGSYQMRASGGNIWLVDTFTYSISGGAPAHWSAHAGGVVYVINGAVTISGTPAFSEAFARYATGGAIEALSVTFSGSATGKRFYAEPGGSMNIGVGVSANSYLPGNTLGTTLPGAVSPDGLFNNNIVNLVNIADDAAYSFDLSTFTNGIALLSINSISGAKSAVPSGQFRARASASPFAENVSLDLTNVVITTGALAGTTGTDGKITIAPASDGKLYIENRSGASRQISIAGTSVTFRSVRLRTLRLPQPSAALIR